MVVNCDICGRHSKVALLSSGCAPVTYAACQECRDKRAENIDVVVTWYHLEGGTEAAETYLSRLVAWDDGAYIGREGILSYYAAHRDELIAEMSEESELVDDTVPIDEDNRIPWDGQEGTS